MVTKYHPNSVEIFLHQYRSAHDVPGGHVLVPRRGRDSEGDEKGKEVAAGRYRVSTPVYPNGSTQHPKRHNMGDDKGRDLGNISPPKQVENTCKQVKHLAPVRVWESSLLRDPNQQRTPLQQYYGRFTRSCSSDGSVSLPMSIIPGSA